MVQKDNLMQLSAIAFNAKWVCKIINERDGKYFIDVPFIPVNEIHLPYGLDHITDPSVAVRLLHGSTAVNLLPAYNGINLDLTILAIEGGVFTKRFFITQEEKEAGATTTSNVVAGDSLLVLVPQ